MTFNKKLANLIMNYALLKEAKLLKHSLIGLPGASPSGGGSSPAPPPPASPTLGTSSPTTLTVARAGAGSGGAKAGPSTISPQSVRGKSVNVAQRGANTVQQRTKKKQ